MLSLEKTYSLMKRRTRLSRKLHVESLENRQLLATTVKPLGDLNYEGLGSSPQLVAARGDDLFIVTAAESDRARLWKSQGTAASNQLVKDFGSNSSISSPLFVHDGVLYFEASTLGSARELWRSDGTEQGTFLLKNIRPGRYGSSPSKFTSVGNTLFFVAAQQEGDFELWKTDGSEDGTVLVKDIRPGIVGSRPSEMFEYNGKLYFYANDGVTGTDLWVSDGNENGTKLVKDLDLSAGSSPAQSVVLNEDAFVFFARSSTGNNIYHLWRSDGTTGGTSPVKEILLSQDSPHITLPAVRNGIALFSHQGSDGNLRLWKTDGTSAGTQMLDLAAATPPLSAINWVSALEDAWAFAGTSPETGTELWKTDGTAAGTVLVRDMTQGPASTMFGVRRVVGNRLFFSAVVDGNSAQIWASDLTTQGTVVAGRQANGEDVMSPFILGTYKHEVVFRATTFRTGEEVWRSVGRVSSAELFTELDERTSASIPKHWTTAGEHVFFSGHVNNQERNLFATNGTPGGTKQLPAEVKTEILQDLRSKANLAGQLVFVPDATTNSGGGLWVSDGTETGTYAIEKSGFAGSVLPRPLGGSHNALPFLANMSEQGLHLYRMNVPSNGSASLIEFFGPLAASTVHSSAFSSDGIMYFLVKKDGSSVCEIWRTDGTASGTYLLKGISNSGEVFLAAETQNGIVFYEGGISSRRLWHFNSSNAILTLLVERTYVSNLSLHTEEMTELQGRAYFSLPVDLGAPSTDAPYELWVSDGTLSGTRLLRDLNPAGDDLPLDLIVANQQLFFKARDGNNRVRIWKSDGTEAGTVPIMGINDSSQEFDFYTFVPAGDSLFILTSTDSQHTWRLMEHNLKLGTTLNVPGTGQLTLPSPLDFPLYASRGIVYFTADDGVHGYEPYLIAGHADWQNPSNRRDVDGNSISTPLDALLIINELTNRRHSDRMTGELAKDRHPPKFYDVNRDGIASPLDALLVINGLGSDAAAGQAVDAGPGSAGMVLINPTENILAKASSEPSRRARRLARQAMP